MKNLRAMRLAGAALAGSLYLSTAYAQIADPLASWNDGASKARIVSFVQAVTEPGGKDFVAPAERIGFVTATPCWCAWPK